MIKLHTVGYAYYNLNTKVNNPEVYFINISHLKLQKIFTDSFLIIKKC